MKSKDVDYFVNTIVGFIQDMALFEDDLTKEAPKLWAVTLPNLIRLSNIATILDNAKASTYSDDLNFYNKLRVLNGLKPEDSLPDFLNTDKDIDVNSINF